MFEVGFTEIILIFGIALLVLGPARLPKLAADIGRWAGRARSMARQLRSQLEQETQFDPLADTDAGGLLRQSNTIHTAGIDASVAAGTERGARLPRPIPRPCRRPTRRTTTPAPRRHSSPRPRHPPAPHRPRRSLMSQSPAEGEPLAEGTLVSHLLELRDRLLRSVIAVVVCFVPLAFFQNELFTLVARPLIDKLPAGTSLIATSVVSPFMAPLKLSLIGAIFLAMPYILFQVWGFVAPGTLQARAALRGAPGRLEHRAVLRGHRVRLLRRLPADVPVPRVDHAGGREDDDGHRATTWTSCCCCSWRSASRSRCRWPWCCWW